MQLSKMTHETAPQLLVRDEKPKRSLPLLSLMVWGNKMHQQHKHPDRNTNLLWHGLTELMWGTKNKDSRLNYRTCARSLKSHISIHALWKKIFKKDKKLKGGTKKSVFTHFSYICRFLGAVFHIKLAAITNVIFKAVRVCISSFVFWWLVELSGIKKIVKL